MSKEASEKATVRSANSCKTQRNPSSKRCVLSDGFIGKHIVGRPILCDTVRNPKTNRCILRTNASPSILRKGSTRKAKSKRNSKTKRKTKSKAKSKPKSKPKGKSIRKVRMHVTKNDIECLHVPKAFEELAEKCACNDVWLKKTKLGSGAFGKVYRACKYKDCNYVVKVQKNDAFAQSELNAYMALQKSRVIPKLFAAWTCKGKMYLVLERLYECKKPRIQVLRQISQRVAKLLELGWLHCDLHWGNIMCTDKDRLVLIDFGLSVRKGDAPYLNHKGYSFSRLKARQHRQLEYLKSESMSSR